MGDQQQGKTPGGVFDRPQRGEGQATTKPAPAETPAAEETAPPEKKEDFQTPFEQQEDLTRRRATSGTRKPGESYAEQAANQINKAAGETPDLTEEMKEAMSVSEDDLALAEKLVFDGYAEVDVTMPNIPDKKFTICSTNAEEMSVIDEIIFDMVTEKEGKDGRIDLPQNHIQTWRNAMYVALGYRGMNQKELCDKARHHLNTIKKAIQHVSELMFQGELKQAEELKDDMKKAVKARALRVRRMPTPMVDFLSGKKVEFDQKMFAIMSAKDILPKS